ncbi:MAG: ATP-dependent Clp protease ATP-binding subunit [Deltaproteobacteria bacterium]|nr:ATP-dependent Clp protease ATP-binding subunit [Deltaproteobacteria bacterium]
MKIEFTVGIYQRKHEGDDQWYALVPQRHVAYIAGKGEVRLRERMVTRLRELLRQAAPEEQELFQLPLGTELVRVPVDVRLEDGRVQGLLPLIVEPRWVSDAEQRLFVYHPRRRAEWFLAETRDDVIALAPVFARHHWKDLGQEVAAALLSNGKDRLAPLAFSTEAQSLLDRLPSRKKPERQAAAAPREDNVLHTIGVDETHRVSAAAPVDVPRSPYRERLGYLLGGQRPRSVAVVGPPGCGKTTLIQRWIHDRLVEDGYPLHKNLDRVHHVWRLSGKRVIAGMSYLGQWEERCLALLEEAHGKRAILWVEDLHLWGRLGQSRQSERSFADFFRGPVRRGDLALVAELTPEQLARLERDAPGLAEALAPVVVPAASPEETAQLLLHEIRAVEAKLNVELHPFVPRTALELGAALFPWRARPGVAIEIVRRVAEDGVGHGAAPRAIAEALTPVHVLLHLARTTGLPAHLISLDEPLDAGEVEAAFAARVIGQPAATRAAADTILRVRAGLADPHRPVAVMLFTGPTGTGKTELATAIAEYLYGGGERLLRIDMGELSGPDAVARLIGDRWGSEGLLTSRVRAQPFCVVLLDEIEKAHPQALHLLLQLFDEGRLTDAAGDVASFASAVVIMTSNLGSRNAQPIGFGETRDRILADVARAVREFFPVELFNRIDRVVPFEPLTPDVAAKVVDKELAKLLVRRGLRERNTFVYAGSAVRRRAVTDAFDPRYGARTVKRWLEDKIGGSLTDLLATAPPARLRIVRLSEDAGTIHATLEPMQERGALPGPYALEGALDVATAGLEPSVARAARALERIATSPHLAAARGAAKERIGSPDSSLAYYLDELEQRVAALGELFGVRPVLVPGDGDLEDDVEPLYEDHLDDRIGGTRRVRTRRGKPALVRSPASRDALIAGIAEALLLERALPQLLDPDAHAVTVVLSRIGNTADAGGLAIAAATLARPTWIDDAATADAQGEVAALPTTGFKLPEKRVALPAGLATGGTWSRARDAALVLRGLFVREALAGDHGTWMIRAAAAEPDVVRVDVRPGSGGTAIDTLRRHVAARRELERVLEHGGALPPNPDVLLPVTRTLTYRAPIRPGETYQIEIEDFSTGWVDRGTARDLPSAIHRAWHLGWSRDAGGAGGAR